MSRQKGRTRTCREGRVRVLVVGDAAQFDGSGGDATCRRWLLLLLPLLGQPLGVVVRRMGVFVEFAEARN